MIRFNKNALLIAVLLIGTLGFANCNSAPTATNSGNTAPDNAMPTEPTHESLKVEAGDKIGIPECDEYIEKYQACINTKVPEVERIGFKRSFEAIQKGWKDSLANPQTKAGLAVSCKQAVETAKVSMIAYSCDW